MNIVHCRRDPEWMSKALSTIRYTGFAVVEGVLDEETIRRSLVAVEDASRAIERAVGKEQLYETRRHGYNELRLAMKYEPYCMRFLEVPEMLQVVDRMLGQSAVLRFQNIESVPRHSAGETPLRHSTFHMNTPRVMHGYVASLDVVFPLTPLRAETRDLLFVPGTHQQSEPPDVDYLEWAAVGVSCPPGGMVVFDSTLWHRENHNRTNDKRVFLVNQFTRSFVKPHFDYVRALGDEFLLTLPERTRQLLGWHTRLPTSLEEFYVPAEQRMYRAGQG